MSLVFSCLGDDGDDELLEPVDSLISSSSGGAEAGVSSSLAFGSSSSEAAISNCGGVEYDLAEDFCQHTANGPEVKPRCDGRAFLPTSFSLEAATIKLLCDGQTYAAAEFCQDGAVKLLCGDQPYTSQQFCCDAAIGDSSSQFCCGGVIGNSSTHRCQGNTIVAKPPPTPPGPSRPPPPTIPEPYNAAGATAVADFIRGFNYDFITVTEDYAGRVIVEHIPGKWEEMPQFTLDIPAGVKVEWGIGGSHSVEQQPTLTLEGYGTLELTSEYSLRQNNAGDAIFIESGSPTLVISRTNINSIDGTAIKTASGSSPNIFLSNASGVRGGAINGGAIVLLGGGNIVVTGSTTIQKGTYANSFIYRGPSATVNGFYDNNINKAYFDGGSWEDDKNLFPE
jgi:hypothetical protein